MRLQLDQQERKFKYKNRTAGENFSGFFLKNRKIQLKIKEKYI